MELICLSTFSVTRKGVRTVYPAYPERILCLRLNNKILAHNLFDIHRTGSHVIELNAYDATGVVLMPINDTEQYKKILEKLYMRVLIYGATFDYQPRHGCDYDTALILSTYAPENVIVLAISKILAAITTPPSEADVASVGGMSSASAIYHTNPHASYAVNQNTTTVQPHIEATLTSIKESLYNMNNILQSLDSRMYTVEDRCDAMDGHIGALGEYNKPIKPPSFCGQSDTDSSVHTAPQLPIYSGRYTGTYTPQTNLQYSGMCTRSITVPMSTYSVHDNVLLSSTQSSAMSSVSSAHTLHTSDDILASLRISQPSPSPSSYYEMSAAASPCYYDAPVIVDGNIEVVFTAPTELAHVVAPAEGVVAEVIAPTEIAPIVAPVEVVVVEVVAPAEGVVAEVVAHIDIAPVVAPAEGVVVEVVAPIDIVVAAPAEAVVAEVVVTAPVEAVVAEIVAATDSL